MTQEQEVRIGERRGASFEVVEGLSAGDVILLDAQRGRVGKVNPENTPRADGRADAPIAAK